MPYAVQTHPANARIFLHLYLLWSDSKIRLRTLRALTALMFEARKEKSCDLSPARSQPAPLEARQPRSKPWRRRLPPLPGRAERRRRAAQATTSAPPTGGAAAAAPTAPPSAAARRLSSGRRQVPRAEGATGPADVRPAETSSSMAGRAPPRCFSAHWRAEEAAGVAAGIGGGASSVLGSEADFASADRDRSEGCCLLGWPMGGAAGDIAASAEAGGDQRSGWGRGAYVACHM